MTKQRYYRVRFKDIASIDIKYQSNVSAVVDSGVSGTYYNNSALIIYREKENNG